MTSFIYLFDFVYRCFRAIIIIEYSFARDLILSSLGIGIGHLSNRKSTFRYDRPFPMQDPPEELPRKCYVNTNIKNMNSELSTISYQKDLEFFDGTESSLRKLR